MTHRISVTEGALQQGAQAVNAAHGEISGSLTRVMAELQALSAAWTGAAASSHATTLTTWDAHARRLNQTLAGLENALRATERDQAAVEEQHTAVIGGLGTMMTGDSR